MARLVLVADDSPTIQKRAVALLKGEGFDVETVSNGVAAIKRLAVLHPVVVLADVSMPGRDGYEVCEHIKKSADLSHVPVLLVASDMEPYDSARGQQVGADGLIQKPFEPQELISVVSKFAAQFEATARTLPAPAPLPAPEFSISNENRDETQHARPDFSSAPAEAAFAEPSGQESLAPTVVAPQSPSADFPLVVDAPFVADPIEPSPAQQLPSYFGDLEAAAPEPIFVEEQPPQADPSSTAAEFRTMIFGYPGELADSARQDDSIPSPPAPEPAQPTTLEAQIALEPVAAQDAAFEQPREPEPPVLKVIATSLDSFSLDEAAGGQADFSSGPAEATQGEVAQVEVAQTAPIDESPVPESAVSEPVPEEAAPEIASGEPVPAQVAFEPAEVASAEAVQSSSVEEFQITEAAPPEPAPEAVASEPGVLEAAPELLASQPAELAPVEVIESAAPEEVPFSESTPTEPTAVASEVGVPGPAPVHLDPELEELASAEVPESASAEENASPQSASPEAPVEEVPAVAVPALEPEVASAEHPVEPPASQALNWAIIYSIVHKVVLRMSPPPLPKEALEQIAIQLADEIAVELIPEASRPRW